ncbi:protein-tyrosine-phosphatase [bacterium]|nr:protein-tyrosine-phosphatase [bacterium]
MPVVRAFFPASLTRRTLLAAVPVSFLPTPGLSFEVRPATWARQVLPEVKGVPNLYQVTAQIYRSAQPDAAGFEAMAQLGVRSVVSLRQTVSDAPMATGTELAVYRVPMKSRHVGEKNGAKVVQAMRDLRYGLSQGPVLVHCHHGADRTGLIAALWRILYEGWSRQAAIDELIEGGYGFHPIWANIPRYLREVDLADLRERIES